MIYSLVVCFLVANPVGRCYGALPIGRWDCDVLTMDEKCLELLNSQVVYKDNSCSRQL